MAEDLAVRSEKPSLESLSQTLAAIEGTEDTDELAYLLLLAAEVYSDARCRCEEKEAAYGIGEALSCYNDAGRARVELLDSFKNVIDKIKGG